MRHRLAANAESIRPRWRPTPDDAFVATGIMGISAALLAIAAFAVLSPATKVGALASHARLLLLLSVVAIVSINVWMRAQARGGTMERLNRFALPMSVLALPLAIGIVAAGGLDPLGNSINSWRIALFSSTLVLIFAAGGIVMVGGAFIADFVYPPGPVLMDVFPASAWPYGAYLLTFVLAVVAMRGRYTLAAVRSRAFWGFGWLLGTTLYEMAATPFYKHPDRHSFAVFLLALLIPGAIAAPLRTVARMAGALLVGAFMYQIGVIMYKAGYLEGTGRVYFSARYAGGPGRIGGSGGAVMWVQNFLIMAPVALHVLWHSRLPRILFFVIAASASYCVYRGDVRAAMLAIPAALIVYCLLLRRPGLAIMFTLLLGILVVVYAAVTRPFADIVETGGLEGGGDNTLGYRWLLWKSAIGELGWNVKHWLFGLGNGTSTFVDVSDETGAWSEHNYWVHTVHATGLIGLALLLGYFRSVVRGCVHTLRFDDPVLRGDIAALVASFVIIVTFSMTAIIEIENATLAMTFVVMRTWAVVAASEEESLQIPELLE